MNPIEPRNPTRSSTQNILLLNSKKTPPAQKSLLISPHKLSTLATCPGVKLS